MDKTFSTYSDYRLAHLMGTTRFVYLVPVIGDHDHDVVGELIVHVGIELDQLCLDRRSNPEFEALLLRYRSELHNCICRMKQI